MQMRVTWAEGWAQGAQPRAGKLDVVGRGSNTESPEEGHYL